MDKKDEQVEDLLKQIGDILESKGQGFIFSTYANKKDDKGAVMNCMTTQNPDRFWISMLPLAFNMNKHCPEDDREDFRDGFIKFTRVVAEECFPSLDIIEGE